MLTTLINGFRNGIVAIFLIAFPLSGCIAYIAHDISKSNPSAPPEPEPPKPSGTMLKSQFRIGISPDYMPLAYKDATVGLVGVEVDFANQLGKDLGKTIVFVETPFPELIPSLLEERIDIIMSGMSITREREKRVNFTDSYVTIGQMVARAR